MPRLRTAGVKESRHYASLRGRWESSKVSALLLWGGIAQGHEATRAASTSTALTSMPFPRRSGTANRLDADYGLQELPAPPTHRRRAAFGDKSGTPRSVECHPSQSGGSTANSSIM